MRTYFLVSESAACGIGSFGGRHAPEIGRSRNSRRIIRVWPKTPLCETTRNRARPEFRRRHPKAGNSRTVADILFWGKKSPIYYSQTMSDPDQVTMLRNGVITEWNAWRRANPAVVPDLFNADLSKVDLASDDATGINLYRANLEHATLIGTNLHGANLRDANFRHTRLAFTIFGNANLTGARGLEYCQHLGPSIVDYQTIAKSWPLPVSFLRGCGLPENLIEYLPSLLQRPIEFYSCFISYSTKDQDFVDRIYADLQLKGVRCWLAPEELKIGDRFRQRIDEAIRLHDKLLLVLSKHSVQSDWVREEVESCLEREHREKRNLLFPITLDDAIMETNEAWAASIRRQRHIGNFREWKKHDSYSAALERVLRDLKPDDGESKNGLLRRLAE